LSNISQMHVTFGNKYNDDSYADVSVFRPGTVIHDAGDTEKTENMKKWDVTQVGEEIKRRSSDDK